METIPVDTAYCLFLNHVEKTLVFEVNAAAVSDVTYPHTTGWRTLSSLMLASISGYKALIQRKGAPDFEVASGETICICPGITHRIEMTSRKPGISRWAHVTFTILEGVDIFTVLAPASVIRGAASEKIGEINSTLAYLHNREEPDLLGVLREKSVSASLLSIIAEHSQIRPQALPAFQASDRIAPVLKFIRSNLKGNLTRECLAREANLSASRFDTLFKNLLGKSPMAYVHGLRLKEAEQLLLNSDLSVQEIGYAVGHEDPFHFSRTFKQFFGSSPLQFRRQAKERIL